MKPAALAAASRARVLQRCARRAADSATVLPSPFAFALPTRGMAAFLRRAAARASAFMGLSVRVSRLPQPRSFSVSLSTRHRVLCAV